MSEESRTFEFEVTPEPMLPAPCPWWRRWWLKLRRKPLPTIQPPGTQPFMFEYDNADGIHTRMYFPAARISTTPLPPNPDGEAPGTGWTDAGFTTDV